MHIADAFRLRDWIAANRELLASQKATAFTAAALAGAALGGTFTRKHITHVLGGAPDLVWYTPRRRRQKEDDAADDFGARIEVLERRVANLMKSLGCSEEELA